MASCLTHFSHNMCLSIHITSIRKQVRTFLYQCVPDPFISLPRQRLRLIANATYEPTGAHANCAGWMWLAASDGQKTSEADARSCWMFVLDIPRLFDASALAKRNSC